MSHELGYRHPGEHVAPWAYPCAGYRGYSASSSAASVQKPTIRRVADPSCRQVVCRPEHVKLCAPTGRVGCRQMHEVLEHLPLAHRVVAVPSRELELGHAAIGLHVIGTGRVVACGQRRASQNLIRLQQLREGERDRRGVDQIVDPPEPATDEQRAAQQVRGDTASADDRPHLAPATAIEFMLDVRDLRRQRLVLDEPRQGSCRSFKRVIVTHESSIARTAREGRIRSTGS